MNVLMVELYLALKSVLQLNYMHDITLFDYYKSIVYVICLLIIPTSLIFTIIYFKSITMLSTFDLS